MLHLKQMTTTILDTKDITITTLDVAPSNLNDVEVFMRSEWGESAVKQVRASIDGWDTTFVAIYNGMTIGSSAVLATDLPEKKFLHLIPWIGNIYVKPEFRGLGVGRILIEKALDEVVRRNFKKCYLWVDPKKSNLIRTYNKHGFISIEETPLNTSKDVLIMEKIFET